MARAPGVSRTAAAAKTVAANSPAAAAAGAKRRGGGAPEAARVRVRMYRHGLGDCFLVSLLQPTPPI